MSDRILDPLAPMTANDTQVINLNIGGKAFRLMKSSLIERWSQGFLSHFVQCGHEARLELCDTYFKDTGEYYFQRSSKAFDSVFHFYTEPVVKKKERGLHCPQDICFTRFLEEMVFWKLPPSLLAPCCRPMGKHSSSTSFREGGHGLNSSRRGRRRKSLESPCLNLPVIYGGNNIELVTSYLSKLNPSEDSTICTYLDNSQSSPLDDVTQFRIRGAGLNPDIGGDVSIFCNIHPTDYLFNGLKLAGYRRRLWRLTEDAASSNMARVFACFSILFVLISVSALILSSLPEFQVPVTPTGIENQTNDTVHNGRLKMAPHHSLEVVETVCIIWFTFELLLRFATSPRKLEFTRTALNVIDFMAIIPFYLELFLDIIGCSSERMENIQGAMLVIRILRVLRVTRVFKIARYSEGLQNFGKVLQKSISELGMLFLFLATAVIFFGTIMYFLEKDIPGTHFPTIPDACWWCVITMTTVGYGDVIPISVGGKLIASLASISGVLVLAFPITTIVDKFAQMDPSLTTGDSGDPARAKLSVRVGGGSKFNFRRTMQNRNT